MSVNLSPLGGAGAQFFSNNGVPLAGGLLYTYLAGTTTPAATYTSSSGATALANPIVLDSAGRVPTGEIWLTDTISYKIVLKTSLDVLIATWDNLVGINSNIIGFTAQQETATATAGQTVFNTTLNYVPGTNNLAVYVNGSKQIVTTNYTETDSNTVTFLTGLNVGDLVQFSTASPVASNAVFAYEVSYTPNANSLLSTGTVNVALDSLSNNTTGSSVVGCIQGGTGATARTVQAKLRDFVSVKDFGAVADGNVNTGAGTNNSPMFQAAINALGAGGSLYIPAGNYVLATQVTVPSNFSITGAGAYQTFLIATTAFNSDGLLKLNGAGGPPTNISNLCVGGQVGGAGAVSIGINSVANGVFLRNLWLTGFKTNVVLGASDNFLLDSASEETIASGVGISITSTDVTVANCVTYNCYVGLSVGSVAYVDGTITLSNIRSLACTYAGFIFTSSSNIQMSNCSVGHSNVGRYTYAGVAIDVCSNININNFIGRLGAKSATARGIYVTSSSDVSVSNSSFNNWNNGVEVANSASIRIDGNISSNNKLYGISVDGGDRVSISNNTCFANGDVSAVSAGIYANNTAGYALYSLVGNTCTQNGGGPQKYGINNNLTDNAGASGFTNLVGNMVKYNTTAQINSTGKVANITSTGNVV